MKQPVKMKRFPRRNGNSFITQIKPGLFCFGVVHNSGTSTFFNVFPSSPENFSWPDEMYPEVLFTVSVFSDFFKWNDTYKVTPPTDFDIAHIEVPEFVIRNRMRAFDPDNPWGLDGPFPWHGGDLYRLKDRYLPADSSSGELIIADLDCDTNRAEIEAYEMSVIHPNFYLRERLVACWLSGKNVCPLKAKVFDDCDYLKNEHVLNTSYYVQHKMPLIGAELHDDKWVQL